ncbi:MAG: xanthine dehydrogenase family protein subunit M [Terriglobales bacterium]
MYIRPKTVDDALSSLATHQAQILSGGTDFFPALGDRAIRGTVIDISAIRALRGITCTADQTRIGALTTWTDIVRAPLPRCFDALKDAAREIGAIQIQNRGTIAGNLCNASPAADGAPPLLALDAEVELASTAGLRRMPLAEFIVGNRKTLRRPKELLTAVIVPRTLDDASSSFVKLGARRYLVISISMIAAVVLADATGRVAAARVAVGSCSAFAGRLSQLEHDLIGAPVDAGLGARVRAEHLSALSPIDDVRATAQYRRDASLTLVQRALNRCAEKH